MLRNPVPWKPAPKFVHLALTNEQIDRERIVAGVGSSYECDQVMASGDKCKNRAITWHEHKPYCGTHNPTRARSKMLSSK